MAEMERHAMATESAGDIVQALHRLIAEQPNNVAPDASARKLGMSLRSLQRRLHAEGTTFQRELTSARVRLTQAKMLEGDAPLGRIATEIGFASPAVFSVAFRKLVGTSPSNWRETMRLERQSAQHTKQ